MTNPEQLYSQEYFQLLGTVMPSIRGRSFESFDDAEVESIIHANTTEPLYRDIVLSIDPGSEAEPINTIAEAVRFMVPRVVDYAERHDQTVEEMVLDGYILGIRGIYLYNYAGIGFALWRPVPKDPTRITWNSTVL